MVRFTVKNFLPSAVDFTTSLATNPKSSIYAMICLEILLHSSGQLCRLGEMLVPSHCGQMLKLSPVECVHLEFLTGLSYYTIDESTEKF